MSDIRANFAPNTAAPARCPDGEPWVTLTNQASADYYLDYGGDNGAEGANPCASSQLTACRFAGHVLLDHEWFGSLPPHEGMSHLEQREVRGALAWVAAELGVRAVVETGEFNPARVGTMKLRRLAMAADLVNEAIEPHEDRVTRVYQRAKTAASILIKSQRWAKEHQDGNEHHPLRAMCDVYGLLVQMRPGVTREEIWKILRSVQAFVNNTDEAAAPDVALDGCPALAEGGNRATANGYSDQKLRFHLMLGHDNVPVELMMLTTEQYQIYRQTHDVYGKNRRQF